MKSTSLALANYPIYKMGITMPSFTSQSQIHDTCNIEYVAVDNLHLWSILYSCSMNIIQETVYRRVGKSVSYVLMMTSKKHTCKVHKVLLWVTEIKLGEYEASLTECGHMRHRLGTEEL